MTQINLETHSLGEMIRNLSTVGGNMAAVTFTNNNSSDIELDSFDKYLECIEAMNKTFQSFGSYLQKDAQGIEAVRQQFIADDDWGSKVFTNAND